MNSLKISSSLIAFKQEKLSSSALDALVSGVISGLDPEKDQAIISQWKDWDSLAYDAKEYKKGWKSYHNTGRFPPQMVSKNSRGQGIPAILAEVERVCTYTSALWGRQNGNSTFLLQESRKQSTPEKNASRQLNNQRAVEKLALREVPDVKDDIQEIGFE